MTATLESTEILDHTSELVKVEEKQAIYHPMDTNTWLPVGEEAQMISQWASMVAGSPYYQKEGGKAGIISKWLAARELGIPPMVALNGGLHYVQGQITISSTVMNGLIRKRGHSIQKIQHNDEICELKGERKDNKDTAHSIFTIQQAKKAQLIKPNSPWEKYPARMLFNRALSNLAKDLFPDCIGSAYVEGELDTVEMVATEITPHELSKEKALFIKKYDLLDEDSEMSQFIKRISDTLDQSVSVVIEDAAKNEETFLKSFNDYKAKRDKKISQD